MPDQLDATRQPVGLVDNELAGPNPHKTGALGGDYPQGKQRKETGVARKTPISAASAKASPAQQRRPNPRTVWGFQARKRARRLSEPFNLVEAAGIEPASASTPP